MSRDEPASADDRIIELLDAGRYEEALGVRATATSSEATAAFVRLSARYAGQERVRIALNKARGTMLAESDIERGGRLDGLGESDAAVEYFQRAVVQNVGLSAYRKLGQTLSRLERNEEAIPYLEQAVQLGDEASDYYWLGATLTALGRHKAALPHLRVAVLRRGRDFDHDWLATALLALGRRAESVPHLRKVVELRGEAEDHHVLGKTLSELGQFETALPYLETAETERGSDEDCRWLGRTLAELGKYDEARPYLEQASLEGDAEDHLWLGRALAESGCREAAVGHIRSAIAQRENAADYNLLGRTLAELAQDEEAVFYLRLAALKRGDPSDYQELGSLLARVGKQAEAEACFDRVRTAISDQPRPSAAQNVGPESEDSDSSPSNSDERSQRSEAQGLESQELELEAPEPQKPDVAGRGSADPTSGVSLRWDDLSKEAQGFLTALRDNAARRVLWSYPLMTHGSIAWRIVAGLAGIACMYYWIVEAEDQSSFFLALAACGFGIYHLVVVSSYVWSHVRGPLPSKLYLTPTHLIHAQGKRISAWPLWAISNIERRDGDYAGIRSHSKFTFSFGAYSFKLAVFHSEKEVSLRSQHKAALDRAVSEANLGNGEYFESNDPFASMRKKWSFSSRRSFMRNWLLRRSVVIACALLLTGLAIFPARQMQDWCDDNRQWSNARALGSASSFRTYLQHRPKGRYVRLVEQRLDQIYVKASERYSESINVTQSDQAARDTVLEMLREAGKTGSYKVGVYFERQNEIPEDIEESVKKRFGVVRVSAIADAFSDANMRAREEAIVGHIKDAFGKIISEDVLGFEMSPKKLPPLWLVVTYRVRAGNSIYFNTKEESLGEGERSYYPGVFFDWQIQLCPGESSRRYVFAMSSSPADRIQVRSSGEASPSNIYSAMSDSAFTSLEHEVEQRFGLSRSMVQ